MCLKEPQERPWDAKGHAGYRYPVVQVHLLERSSRSHLMGFADMHTDGGDRLYVLYKWQDRFFEMDGALYIHIEAHADS